jgi:ABC-type phosphonate transport system ATPase subunit
MSARRLYQLAEVQRRKRALHGAFGQAGFIGQHARAGFDRLPVLAGGAAGKKEINQEGRRLLIMPDDIAHERVENVIIDRNGSVKASHDWILPAIPIKGQHFSCRIAP